MSTIVASVVEAFHRVAPKLTPDITDKFFIIDENGRYRTLVFRDLISLSGILGGFSALSIHEQSAATLTIEETTGSHVYLCDCTSNAIAITLPTAISNSAEITIQKVAGTYDVTVDGYASQTINGSGTITISTVNTSIPLFSDNTNWRIF